MTDETPQSLLEGFADKVLPDQSFLGDIVEKVLPSGAVNDGATREEDQFHDTNSDEIKSETIASTIIPNLSEKMSEIATESTVEVTQYLPELDYPPRTPSSHNKSLDMYSTPDQEEREPIQMRKLDLATDSEIPMGDLRPIVSPMASPTKEKVSVDPASILGDSDIVTSLKDSVPGSFNVDHLLEKAQTGATELAPDLNAEQLTEKLETAVTESTSETVNQLKETMETNLTELAPDTKVDQMADKLKTAVAESTSETVDQLKESLGANVTELAPDLNVDELQDKLEKTVTESANETIDQLKETIETNVTELAPDINVDELTDKLETAVADSTSETVDQLKELAPEMNVDELTEKLETAVTESTSEAVDQVQESMETNLTELAPVLDKRTESEQEGLSTELPAERHAERAIMVGPVVSLSDAVNEVETTDLEAQRDDSETSTIYEEISEEEDVDEEIIEDDYEEEELIESDDSHEEEEIIDEEEEVVDEEIEGFASGVPEQSTENAPSESIPKSDDAINDNSFSSASSGGAFLSAIEEGDEHSYQSGDLFAPLPPVTGAQGDDESPVAMPAGFVNVSEEQTEELPTISASDEGVEVEQSEASKALDAETPEEIYVAPTTSSSDIYVPVDLSDPNDEQDQLPPGWKSHIDPDSGDTYYYNEESGETTWEIEDIEETSTKQEALDKDVMQSGKPAITCETMAIIPEADVEESSPTYSDPVVLEKEQSLVVSNDYGDPEKAIGLNNESEEDNEKRVEELLEDSNGDNPFKSPAVLCLLCAICLLLLALVIAIPLALNKNKNDDSDREITFPTKAPSPTDSDPAPATAPTPSYELAFGPFGDSVNTGFGRSVSFDNGLLLVGLPSEGQGIVRSFQINQSGKMLSVGDILGEQEGSGFGWAVDIADTVAAVGSPFLFITDTPTEAGGVYVYEYSGSTWSQVGETLRGDEDLFAANEAFGSAVSLSVTDSVYRVVVGAPISNLNDFEIGRVYTFEKSVEQGSAWTGIDSTALLGERAGDRFGSSVAISKDGTTFVAGGPGGDLHDDPGLVFVYKYTGDSTEAWEMVFSMAGSEENERFGASVAMLSDNGDIFAIGAPDFSGGSGRVLVYRRDDMGVYLQLGADIVGDRGERIGEANVLSGSASGDSVQVVVGTAKGKVLRYDYSEESQSWSMKFDELDPEFSAVTSISVSGKNAASIAIGSELDGSVKIYETSGDGEGVDPSPEPVSPVAAPAASPTISPVLSPTAAETVAPVVPTAPVSISESPAPVSVSETTAPTFMSRQEWSLVGGPFSVDIPQSGYGSSVAMSGTLMAIGAPFTLSESGSVHTYINSNGEWQQSEELYGEETSGGFGFSLDVGGQGLLVGAPLVNDSEGTAYYYEPSGGLLTRVGEPLGGDGAVGGGFGSSVAVSSNRVAIIGSATYSSDGLSGRGAFYIFEYVDAWTSTALEAGFEGGDSLGYAVDIDESGLIAVAGAPGNAAGYASVFEKRGDVWESTLIISGETDGDACGTSVKVLSSTFIAVGAPGYMQGRGRVVVYEKIGDIFEEMTSIIGDEGDAIGSNLQLTGSDTSIIIGKSNGTIIRLDYDGASSEWIQITESVDPGLTEGLGALASPPGDATTFSVGGGQTALVYRISQPS